MAKLKIEVVYALPEAHDVQSVRLPPGATVKDAIAAAGVCARHPEIDLARQAIGIYGHRVTLNAPLEQDDRVEIFRALLADPKASRRRRAAKRGR